MTKKKKETEAFERGDVVEFDTIGGWIKGIYISETAHYYNILADDNEDISALEKDLFPIRKTGKHIDLSLK